MREQQRQAYLQQQLRTQQQLGQDQAAIQSLQRELEQQNLKVDAMKQAGAETNTGAATEKDIEALKLRLQLMEQEKEMLEKELEESRALMQQQSQAQDISLQRAVDAAREHRDKLKREMDAAVANAHELPRKKRDAEGEKMRAESAIRFAQPARSAACSSAVCTCFFEWTDATVDGAMQLRADVGDLTAPLRRLPRGIGGPS